MKHCPLCARPYPDSARFCDDHALPLKEDPPLEGLVEGELTGHALERRYVLGGLLGAGGMGSVYAARNLRNGADCAVKVLRPQLCTDDKMRRRLLREIHAVSQINHHNVVKVLDYGQDAQAGAFLVMELLRGRGLDEVLHGHGPLPLGLTLKVALQLCDALAAIHGHGLVHCDLKPGNIRLLPENEVKLIDLGLVKPYGEADETLYARVTTAGIAFGTPYYMSPEQAALNMVDPRSDLYGLGVVLFEMLLGQPPFQGKTAVEVLDGHRNRPLPLPRSVNARVVLPSTVEVLLLRLLSKDPADRPTSALAVAESLQTITDGLKLDVEAMDLSTVAAGASPEPAETLPLDTTVPIPAATDDFAVLRTLAEERRPELVQRAVDELCKRLPRYRAIPAETQHTHISLWMDAFLQQLQPSPPTGLPKELEQVLDSPHRQHFGTTELLGGFWIGYWVGRPLMREVAAGDLDRYLEMQERYEQRLLPFYLLLANRNVARFNQQLGRKNELLARQNEELLELRNQLDDQLKRTTTDLAEAERVKARVADSISSGLVLLQLEGQRVMLFNRPLERLSGLKAADVVGRPVQEIFHLVEGVPWEEFVEQVRLHGQVGLRKLRARFPNGRERTVYVRGQPYADGQGRQVGVLFVVEDVTEREKVIESFSRYVSRDVAQRILRGERPLSPRGEHRRAALLAVGVRDFRRSLEHLSPQQTVELLDQYVRVVANAVFHHGGVVDRVVGESVLVYFTGKAAQGRAAARAATELQERIARLDHRRKQAKLPGLTVGIGLHEGEVLLMSLGGQRRMVHTLLGEAVAQVHQLSAVARPGEVLASEGLARELTGAYELSAAEPLDAKGADGLRVVRVGECLDDDELDTEGTALL